MIRISLAIALGLASLSCSPEHEPPQGNAGEQNEPTLSVDARGDVVVFVDDAQRAHMHIETAPATRSKARPTREAFGALVADPARAFELRARLAGTLRAATGTEWPAPGDAIAPSTVLGAIEPRLTPLERSDVATRLASARADLAGGEAELPALRAALERARGLNAQDKAVSDRDLQAAETRLATSEARLIGARELVRVLETASDVSKQGAGELPLRVEIGGTVVEIGARPGESVEAGASILRVQGYDELLARVELPVDGSVSPEVGHADIEPVGSELTIADCERTFAASESASLAPVVWFRVHPPTGGSAAWMRPGQALVARIATRVPEREGIVVPENAIVRLAGKSWVYVSVDAAHYARREVTLDVPVKRDWLVDAEWTRTGEVPLVVRGAGQLLSFELLGVQSSAESAD